MMDIIIAGGGIGGLTAAISLAQAGHQVRVFEQSNLEEPTGMGVGLQPFTVSALQSIGLTDITQYGIKMQSTNFYTHDGKLLYSGVPPADNAPVKLGIKRKNLHAQLIKHATQHSSVTLQSQVELVSLEQLSDQVQVTFRNKETDSYFSEKCDLLVGADGLHSQVRNYLFPENNEVNYSGVVTWRGMSVYKDFLQDKMLLLGGKQAKTVLYPVEHFPNGQVLVYWGAEVRQPQDASAQLRNKVGYFEEFGDYFRDFTFNGVLLADVYRQAERILRFPIVDKTPLSQWVEGRVVLLGDAAHPMFPMGGNGASQAIVDAVTLGNCLKAYGKTSLSTCLEKYESLRLSKVNAVVLSNRKLGPDRVLTDYELKAKTHSILELQPHFERVIQSYKSLTTPLSLGGS